MKFLFLWIVVLIVTQTTIISSSQQTRIITPENASSITELHKIGNGRVFDLVLSPTDDTFALPSYFGIWVHQINNPSAPPIVLGADGEIVSRIDYSPDGQFIVASTIDGIVTLWDIASGTQVYQHKDLITLGLAYSLDGQFIVVMDNMGNIIFLEATTGDIISQIELPTETTSMKMNSQGTKIAFSSDLTSSIPGRGIHLLDITDPYAPRLELHIRDMEIAYDLDFSPDGNQLLAYDFEQVMIWDISDEKNGTLLHTYPQDTYIWDYDVQFDPTGAHFLVASDNGRVSIFDVATGEFIDSLNHPQPVHRIAFSSDNTLYTLANGIIYAWDYENRTIKQTYDNRYLGSITGTMSFSPSMGQLAVGKNYQLELIDTTTWQTITLLDNNGSSENILYITDDRLITSGSSVILWDIAHKTIIATFDSRYSFVAVNPNQDTVAIGLYEDGIALIDPQTGTTINSIPQLGDPFDDANSGPNASITFSPDGNSLAWIYIWDIYVWDVNKNRFRYAINDVSVDWLDYHPSGDFLVGGVWDINHFLVVWDASTGEEIRRFETIPSIGYNPRTGKLSPDGRIVAIVENDIYLFDFETGELLTTITDHKGEVTGITFSPDGQYLVSSSYDGTTRIWGIAP